MRLLIIGVVIGFLATVCVIAVYVARAWVKFLTKEAYGVFKAWAKDPINIIVGFARQMAIGVGIGIGVVITFGANGVIAAGNERVNFKQVMAEYDSYRGMLANVKCDTSMIGYQNLIGEAAAKNARLAHEKESNLHWWSDYFSPDWWNDVAPIKLPCDGTSS